jgi:hypothetical protein
MRSKGLKARKAIETVIIAAIFALLLGLMGCSGGGSGSDVSNENKANAKTVIKAATNVFATTESLDLSEKDSPATIDQNDPVFSEFYAELKDYKTMSGVELKDCSFTVAIQSVTAATARGDSTQTNYRYTITGADMVVNGVGITYDTRSGFSSK